MTEEEIVGLYFERSESAIAETQKAYGNYLRAIAFNILRCKEDAKECENDAYSALWKTIPPEKPKLLKAYIGRIVRNIALSRFDYNKALKRDSRLNVIFSELEECIASGTNTEREYESGEIARYISDFLQSTDREARIIFVRRYWYCDSIKDIAENFSMGQSKVKSSLMRTRNKLKLYLRKEGVTI